MELAPAHAWATGDEIRVAVIDTGVDLDHPELRGRIRTARNCVAGSLSSGECVEVGAGGESFSRDAHGTAVAGVIASAAHNGVGIVGVAPEVEILALKACWYPSGRPSAVCNSFTLAKAIQLAADEGSHVINLSLTGPSDGLLADMVSRLVERDVVIVSPAPEGGEAAGFPSDVPGVLAVGAAPLPGGDDPAASTDLLLAPGHDVLTTQPDGEFDFVTGSSYAAAHVSGLVALMLDAKRVPQHELREILHATSRENTGVNACGAVAALIDGARCPSVSKRESGEPIATARLRP